MRCCLAMVLLLGTLHAQSPSPEPEVRRALPVTREPVDMENFQNPEWVQEVVPVATPLPMDPPPPTPALEPYRPPPAPTPMEEDSIRLGPAAGADPALQALVRGNAFYSRKMYDLAIPEYEMFLIVGDRKTPRDTALFRLAECHRFLGNIAAARSGYERLAMEYQKGDFAGAGAYRLGDFLFGEEKYDAAFLQFNTAANESKEVEVRLTAKYFAARSLEYLKRFGEASVMYEAVVSSEGKNPYKEHAQLALGNIHNLEGKKAEALASYEALIKTSKNQNITAEALVKAAILANELGKTDKALANFSRVAKLTEAADWQPVALIASMRLLYAAGNYKGVLALGSTAWERVPKDAQPEAMQMLAASQRQIGNNFEARKAYDLLLKSFPDSEPAQEARFQRLVCLYALQDKNLVSEIDQFLATTSPPDQRLRASLLKAEVLFKRGAYAEAAAVYEPLLKQELAADLRADALYKFAWSLSAAGDPARGAMAYTEFLEVYPTHNLFASALAQRALAKQAAKAFDEALADFSLLAEKYPGTKEHELALLQKALIYGQIQKYDEMAKTFSELLEKFPKTAAAAQSNFWLGWAAFELKDYPAAIAKLDLARKLDPENYGERASLRIILAHYYQENRQGVTTEAAQYKGGNLPAEITLWLALQLAEEGQYAKAEALLVPLAANPEALPPDAWIALAESQLAMGKYADARQPAEKYLATARDPATRARALMATAKAALGLRDLDEAQKLIEEVMLLQPEGRFNALARLTSGEILQARNNFDGAARAYMTVAVLTDDEKITPLALTKAAEAYRRAKNVFEAEKALTELKKRFPNFTQPSSTNPT